MTLPSSLTRLLTGSALAAVVAAPVLVGLSGTATAAENIPTIGPGYSDNHAGVTCIQHALEPDFLQMNGVPYGTYGQATYTAVMQFQQQNGLPADGAVGPATATALEHATTMSPDCAGHLPAAAPSTTPTGSDAGGGSGAGTPSAPQSAQGSGAPPGSSPQAGSSPAVPDAGPAAPACAETRPAAAAVAKATTVTEPATRRTGDTDDPATIKLRYSAAAHCAWAWIGGSPGAQVWLDRDIQTPTGISTEPGPTREIQEGNENTYGAASPVGGAVIKVRACGQVRQAPVCTAWFDGTRTSTDNDPGSGNTAPAPDPGTPQPGPPADTSSGTADRAGPAGSDNTGSTGDSTGAGSTGARSTGADSSGGARGEQIVSYAQRILHGDAVDGSTGGAVPYSWGAGHGASPGPSTGTCAGYTGRIHPCPATTTVGVDCSGFTRWAYQLAYGRDVLGPGNTDSQLARLHRVDTPAPGDLVFYSPTGKPTGTTHVAIYIGDGKIIDAPATGRDISQETVDSHTAEVGYYHFEE